MFNIYSIFAGWISVSFGERKNDDYSYTGKNGEVISFSYLDDVKEMLDNLFDLKEGQRKTKEFDLEGDVIDIYTILNNDTIYIICNYKYTENQEQYSYSFSYRNFLKEYVATMQEHKELYLREFAYHEEDYRWDNKHWNNIIQKIK